MLQERAAKRGNGGLLVWMTNRSGRFKVKIVSHRSDPQVYTVRTVWKVKKGDCDYALLLGNALVLVVFLDPPLDGVLFLHDAGEADYLPANAIASTAPAKEVCRRGDHKRGIRRTADQTPAGCQYEIGIGDDDTLQHD